MAYNPHSRLHPAISSRLNELLDAIKNEFEAVTQDTSIFKMQRDEFEHKIASQIQEMNQIQQNVYELERAHQKMKQQYEDEIIRLRRELEVRGIPIPPSVISQQPPPSVSPPPQIPGGTSGLLSSTPGVPPPLQHHALGGGIGNGGGPGGQQQGPPNLGLPGQQQQPGPGGYYDDHAKRISATQMYAQHAPPPSQNSIQKAPMQPVPPTQLSQQQQPVLPTAQRPSKPYVFVDVDPDTIPPHFKKEGTDWLTMYNPKIAKFLDINLVHSFDHASVVCCIKYSYDGKFLATGCNRTTQIYDVSLGQLVATLQDETGKEGDLYIRSVCFSPDGGMLATGAEDKQIRIWDIAQKKIRSYLTGHEQDIYSLDFSRDGKFLASGSGDKTAKVWDVESGQCLFTMGGEESGPKDAGVTSVAISPDLKYVASGSLDRVVRIWSLENGKLLQKLEGHKDSVYSIAFSPDGKTIVSGSLDKTLKLWDLSNITPTGQVVCRSTFTGHKDFVLSVAFSQDGRFVISGSKDRSVQIWDFKTGQTLCILQGHKNSVISVALSPVGGQFATGSGDCRGRIWSIQQLQMDQNFQMQA